MNRDINFDAVREQVAAKYITVRKHPTADLFIYNYTPKAMWEGYWTPETIACRGLIADGQDRIVARPFEKFFGYQEYINTGQALPRSSPIIYDKLDGFLCILYWINDEPAITTRGSFISEQAKWATNFFRYNARYDYFDKSKTYLFEGVCRQFRIVVDYKNIEGLFLLAVIDTATGQEISLLPEIGFPHAQRYEINLQTCTRFLSSRATQNDSKQYRPALERQVENVQSLRVDNISKRLSQASPQTLTETPSVEIVATQQNTRCETQPSIASQYTSGNYDSQEGSPMSRLQRNVSGMRYGFRSYSGDKIILGQPSEESQTFTRRDSKVRANLRQLPPDKNISAEKEDYEENREGWVAWWPEENLRLKIKLPEYVRLHKILTQVSTKSIWEFLRDGKPLDEILERVPDEFFSWVRKTKDDLELKYADVEAAARAVFDARPATDDRKLIAEYFKSCSPYPPILFNMLDGKSYAGIIWKLLRPKFEKPFRADIDDA